MKSHHNPWAFLRPLLLALAATAAWVALSAGGASADTGADDSDSRHSMLGSVGSSLRSVTTAVAHQAKGALEPVEATLKGGPDNAPVASVPALIPAPSLGPAVKDVTGLADQVVQSVPVVNRVVPAGTVGTVVDPVAGTVGTVLDRAVETVAPIAGAVLEPLEPVVEPVTDAVPLPGVNPADSGPVPPVVTDAIDTLTSDPASTPAPSVTGLPQAGHEADASVTVANADAAGTAPGRAAMILGDALPGTGQACDTRMNSVANAPALAEAGPDHAPIHEPSDSLPGVPGATTGGSSSSGGNGPAVPAWLNAHHFYVPAAGTAAIEGRLLAAPAPVSFDPGSSPD
ncbi:hypothetical protein [Pseudarthrobacter sp. lyk4-40-TYG-27]|uniref:hypothetical protein n=1 Tax=Pseudarthrobacter sp. lyk4-40-TYG-27 TaxID=3040305 RepID=UPI002553595C|nr:hypothetical protein [Pseudarthrobacter sp. lyk4-40-TYG-27]